MHWRQQTNLCKRFVLDWPAAAIQLKWSHGGKVKKNRFWCLGEKLCLKFAFHEKTVQFQNWFETPRLLHAPGFINFLPEFLSKLTETFLRQICGFASQGFIPSLPKLLSRKSTLASALFPNSTAHFVWDTCKLIVKNWKVPSYTFIWDQGKCGCD